MYTPVIEKYIWFMFFCDHNQKNLLWSMLFLDISMKCYFLITKPLVPLPCLRPCLKRSCGSEWSRAGRGTSPAPPGSPRPAGHSSRLRTSIVHFVTTSCLYKCYTRTHTLSFSLSLYLSIYLSISHSDTHTNTQRTQTHSLTYFKIIA